MTSLVRVEQLLIGWSRTSNGKNVLARSPGWPEGTRQEWVDELGDFLDPAIDRVVRETGEAPWLVEFRPSRHGSILMAKVYAAESLRAGEFQVHALLDPSRRLGPQHLPGLVEAGTLLLERPEDVLRLESIQVEVPPVWEVDARVLALALQFAHCGGSLVLRAHGLPEAMDLLGSVCAALPGLVARETIARSVVTDAADVEGIGVAVAPWSRGAEAVPGVEVSSEYGELAARILRGEVEVPDLGVPSWLDLALLNPAEISGDQLARGLVGPHATDWFTAALETPEGRRLLLDAMNAGEVPAAAWPEAVDGGVARLLGQGVRMQDALARSAPDALVRTWVREGRGPIQSPVLVDRLETLGCDPGDFRLRTGGTRWSAWTEAAWRQWLASGSELWPKLRAGIEIPGFPKRFAGVLDRLSRGMVDNASAQLLRWPAELLGYLAEALVLSRDAPPDLLIQTLDRLPAAEVRALVHQHWPALGHQLGLPAAVVQALKPHRIWFGRG